MTRYGKTAMGCGGLALLIALGLAAQEPTEVGGTEAPDTSPDPRTFEGVIEAYQVVQLSSPADGVLESVTVDRGDLVTKGQVIATLESSVQQATVELADARAELTGELKKRKAQLDYSALRFSQDQELHETGILSEDDFEQSLAERKLAEAQYEEAEENVSLARLAKKQAAAALELRTIRSPCDGVVVRRLLSPGELVSSQYLSKIVEIAQVDSLRVEVILPVSLFGKISTGMEAEVTPETQLEARLKARVTAVDRVIDAASSTFGVRLELPNSEGRLTAGLKCQVRFLDPEE